MSTQDADKAGNRLNRLSVMVFCVYALDQCLLGRGWLGNINYGAPAKTAGCRKGRNRSSGELWQPGAEVPINYLEETRV